jgi:hypothetical protein
MVVAALLTLFLVIVIPIYWKTYGWQNFLWFSDVGLFITTAALWLQSPLLISIVALTILPVELLWNVDFLVQLVSSRQLTGLSSYMFDSKYSLFIRALSLFHCVLPVIIVIYLAQWGYTSTALPYSIFLACSVFLLTYFFTDPNDNINFVFAPQSLHWHRMPALAWLSILILTQLILIIVMHAVLKAVFA